MLGFVATTLSYFVGNPELASNQRMNFGVVVIVYWLATFLTMAGEKSYGKAWQWLFVHGAIIPGLFIMLLAAAWLFMGYSMEMLQSSISVQHPQATTKCMHGCQILWA